MIIVLIGLPGSGKTTVGKQLSKRLNLPFVDSDQVIEQKIGCRIREYFEVEGEDAFRDMEELVLSQVTHRTESCVLSTGGGAVLREGNRKNLRNCGLVFYLKSKPEDLYSRTRGDKSRPLLQVSNPVERLRELFAMRDPLYRETAHFILETGRPSVSTLVNMIQMQFELTSNECKNNLG